MSRNGKASERTSQIKGNAHMRESEIGPETIAQGGKKGKGSPDKRNRGSYPSHSFSEGIGRYGRRAVGRGKSTRYQGEKRTK